MENVIITKSEESTLETAVKWGLGLAAVGVVGYMAYQWLSNEDGSDVPPIDILDIDVE